MNSFHDDYQLSPLVCVDSNDSEVGLEKKLTVHQKGLLHRAFSIFIFRKNCSVLELLLQQRALSKYHTAGLWTNTCCGHAIPAYSLEITAKGRLQYEMGFSCELQFVDKFTYRSVLTNGFIEHEVDHVFVGFTKEIKINPNEMEVADHRWLSLDHVLLEYSADSSKFTPWFLPALQLTKDYSEKKYGNFASNI